MDDVQSWWEIPCIAHFCSLFRLYFDLIDFDIEELEEALLTDSAEEVASSLLLQDLIVRLVRGCFNSQQDEITTCNYQMYLRRLFRKKCEEGSTQNNPFETDAAFHSLPLRTKVEILYDLCDFRLDNDDVPESLNSLESSSLRVEPLGRDSGGSTYWYFYGTRLYREDYAVYQPEPEPNQKRGKRKKDDIDSKWQVVCYTEEDWQLLTRKFKNCKSIYERNLHRTLSSDFLPELPRLFAEKERLQRKRMLESVQHRPVSDQQHHNRDEMPVSSTSRKTIINHSDEDNRVKEGGDDMDEEELRRQREEQEKADRLLAEEIEREERKARLHLRERRGGAVPFSSSPEKSSSRGRSTGSKKSGSRSSSENKSPSKSPVKAPSKKKVKDKKKPKSGRVTNNSLAASIQGAVLSKKGARKNVDAEDEDSDVDEEDEEDEEQKEKKGKREDASSDRNESRSRSQSPSSPKKQKKKASSKLKKSSRSETSDKDKRSKSKEKIKDKKKNKLKKEKSKDKVKKAKSNKETPNNHHSSPSTSSSTLISGGMSKTKVKSSVLFSQTEEDVQIGMHKVVESIKNHSEAWPFMNPVDEDYAPNYYRVISSPMDLQTMEDKLDNQEYCSLDEFIADFQRIVDNCIRYNGPSSEYTEMAETVQEAFNKAIQRYIVIDESDEEISIEYSNLGTEKKRAKPHGQSKKEEHKKENEPAISKTASSPKNKSKMSSDKPEKEKSKKKLKHKPLKHHDRHSIENLDSEAVETLKDTSKWLASPPKPTEYVSSGAAAFDSLRSRILEDDNDREKFSDKHSHKRKAEEVVKNHHPSSSGDEEEQDEAPPKKVFKKAEKHEKGISKSKPEKSSKKKSKEEKSKKHLAKEIKEKEKIVSHHHHHHHRHKHHSRHHSGDSSKRDSSPTFIRKSEIPNSNNKTKKQKKRFIDHKEHIIKDDYSTSSPSETSLSDKPILKHHKNLKNLEDNNGKKVQKPPVRRSNSIFNSLKNSGPVKRIQQGNNNKPKVNSFHAESTKSKVNTESFGVNKNMNSLDGDSNSLGGDKPEKKKCILLNDNPQDQEGGPKLSLGTVLSTDAIKIVDLKKSESSEDGDIEDLNNKPVTTTTNIERNETLKEEKKDGESKSSSNNNNNIKKEGTKQEPENDEEEEETDRKLEPSKGFNREKCMPNLSAWIKAFGGPAKATPPSAPVIVAAVNHTKKTDYDPKSKFKIMGRGIGGDPHPEVHYRGSKGPPIPKGVGKHGNNIEPWNSTHHHPSSMKSGEVINLSEDISEHGHHKKRHRKMSTSSLSSQSESGSPHCFNNQDGSGAGVVNPPRWVDEQWAQNQSQSPSASSHVSSQSPANSPYSPAINSPPHTPQTPPRPVGPVRVGFYQDLTSQHSSPEKVNESHSNPSSNVASPSTPPTPTNNNHSTNNHRRGENATSGNGKDGFRVYPQPPAYHASRYGSSSTPSPTVGPPSNMQSPSPGGMAVESPPNSSSPHSPTVVNVPEYRPPSYNQSTHGQIQVPPLNIPGRPPSAAHSSSSHHRGAAPAAHQGSHNTPSIAPYPPPSNHYGHSSSVSQGHPENAHSNSSQAHQPQPAMAHMNQVQAHSHLSHQHYDRYPPHSLAHHHAMSVATSMTSSSSIYTQNMTAAHSQRPSAAHQPSPYPSNPYASNPRNINMPPAVYNNPISNETAINRFYKTSAGELSLSSSSSESSSSAPNTQSSSSRGRSSRSSAEVESAVRNAASNLEGKLAHGELNGFQWTHNLASLSQIVNSIPNPMNAVGMANAYRQYDQAMAESISKYQRVDPSGYTANLTTSSGSGKQSSTLNPPAAHSQPADKLPSDITETSTTSSRRQSSKGESKSSRSQSSKSAQMVPGSAFNFSSLSPGDLALYPKEMSEGSIYSASPPGLAHRPDLYPTSTSNFHSSFSSSSRSSSGGVGTPSIAPYQIPPFIGSHPSPYQSQSPQPFAHSQPPRGLVDPYQYFQSSPHVMGLLPPTAGYPYPHGLGFNRPGWI